MKFVAYKEETVGGSVGQGFHMTFQNGLTCSVAFGSANYCDLGKTTAEVWAWDGNGEPVSVPGFHSRDVVGHLSPDDVLFYLSAVASMVGDNV